jgi:hypothetical protein
MYNADNSDFWLSRDTGSKLHEILGDDACRCYCFL